MGSPMENVVSVVIRLYKFVKSDDDVYNISSKIYKKLEKIYSFAYSTTKLKHDYGET